MKANDKGKGKIRVDAVKILHVHIQIYNPKTKLLILFTLHLIILLKASRYSFQ